MESFLYVILAAGIGAIIAWLYAKARFTKIAQSEIDAIREKYIETNTLLSSVNRAIEDKNQEIAQARITENDLKDKIDQLKEQLADERANNLMIKENLDQQKKAVEALNQKFTLEFENIANKILETKTQRFTELNQSNMKAILDPLAENIKNFKTQVDETYNRESKERFSLGEKVKELAELNRKISEDAINLTRALKGEAKTQGRWGEMILESILEKSGLEKGREYFMEHQLLDEDGRPMRSESDKKMRPDAVIKYPDNRSVIIDSKVSLNAFTRFIEATDDDDQKAASQEHVTAIKNHIIALSSKGYDDYNQALDFVMMFIPSEPAYAAAMQGDPNLWEFAYDKRILLLSPTNLITSLKLIVDLWKREYQNQNAKAIAERGAKLHDKFVAFVSNLEALGDQLDKAQAKYIEAFKQLSTGNDNLVLQTTKLKKLGLKTKKELPKRIEELSGGYDESEDD